MYPDLDHVLAIAWVFIKPSNHDPHTSCLWTQTRFVTPLSCDIEPNIIKPTSRKIVVSADLDLDLDPVHAISQVFSEPSNHDPHTSCLQNQMWFATPLSFDLEPDITTPTYRNIVVSANIGPDLSAGIDSGGVTYHSFEIKRSWSHPSVVISNLT